MMSVSKLIFVAVLCSIPLMECHAQFSKNPASGATTGSVQYIYNLNELTSPPEYPIEGSPYFNETYLRSNVYSSKGNFTNVEMRYNMLHDRMEFKERDLLYGIDPNLAIEKIVMGTNTFVVDNYEFKGKTIPTFLLRLDSGKITLVTKMMMVFKERQQGKAITGNVPAKYQRMADDHYYKLDQGPLIKIRSIKKLIEALPDHKEEMEEFNHDQKTSAGNQVELTRFIRHYNSLK